MLLKVFFTFNRRLSGEVKNTTPSKQGIESLILTRGA